MDRVNHLFARFSAVVSEWLGRALAFFLAILTIVLWAATGPIFKFSTDWQIVINTATTIITFLMVFLIQNTQNRHTLALHIKLDELLRAVEGARGTLADVEDRDEEDLAKLKEEFVTERGQP